MGGNERDREGVRDEEKGIKRYDIKIYQDIWPGNEE